MKKVKIILEQVIICSAIYYLITHDFNSSIPFALCVFPMVYVIATLYNIYKKYTLLKSLNDSNLRITTNNDDYNKILPFISGAITFVGSIFGLIYSDLYSIFWISFLLNGLLVIVSGFFFIPNGLISFEKNILKFIIDEKEDSFNYDELKEIQIRQNQIEIFDVMDKRKVIPNLNLNIEQINQVKKFLHNEEFRQVIIN